MKAYLINAGARTIEEFEWNYGVINHYLPGGITVGHIFDNGDVLYVDDEGLLHPATVAFSIKKRPDGQPMMSNGILTGKDEEFPKDDTLPPAFTMAQLRDEIEWLSVDQALDWFRAVAKKAAVTLTTDGERQVLANYSDLLRNLEGGEGYKPY